MHSASGVYVVSLPMLPHTQPPPPSLPFNIPFPRVAGHDLYNMDYARYLESDEEYDPDIDVAEDQFDVQLFAAMQKKVGVGKWF